jgi:uncharacterized membrane protein
MARLTGKAIVGAVTAVGSVAKLIGKAIAGIAGTVGALITSVIGPTGKINVTLTDRAVTK